MSNFTEGDVDSDIFEPAQGDCGQDETVPDVWPSQTEIQNSGRFGKNIFVKPVAAPQASGSSETLHQMCTSPPSCQPVAVVSDCAFPVVLEESQANDTMILNHVENGGSDVPFVGGVKVFETSSPKTETPLDDSGIVARLIEHQFN